MIRETDSSGTVSVSSVSVCCSSSNVFVSSVMLTSAGCLYTVGLYLLRVKGDDRGLLLGRDLGSSLYLGVRSLRSRAGVDTVDVGDELGRASS
jgi:hypothetical protein